MGEGLEKLKEKAKSMFFPVGGKSEMVHANRPLYTKEELKKLNIDTQIKMYPKKDEE